MSFPWSIAGIASNLGSFITRNNLGLEIREFIALVFIVFSTPLLFGLFFKLHILLCLLFSILILVLLFGVINFRCRRETVRKEEQFEQFMLDLMGNLYSTPNILNSIEKTIETTDYPLRKEFEHVIAETRRGSLLNDALRRMIERSGSKIIRTVLLGLIVANDKGVDLVEFLKNQIEYVREKKSIENYIKVLSSGPRYTCYIIMVIPLVSIFVILLINKGFLEVLLSDLGILVVSYALLSYAVGFFLINRIINLSK